jgi:hypothetical protein
MLPTRRVSVCGSKGRTRSGFRKPRTQHELIRKMERELKLAKERDELIERSLVENQAAYLVIALRQRILSIPQIYARRI